MREQKRWLLRLPPTLGGRLLSGMLCLLTISILVPSSVTFLTLRSTLYHRLDLQLESAGQGSVEHLIGDAPHDASKTQTLWVVQLSPTGAVLDHLPAKIGNIQHLDIAQTTRLKLTQASSTPISLTTIDGIGLRVISVQQPDLAGTVVLGLSTADVRRTLDDLLLLEMILGAGALALAAVAAIAIRRSLAPLDTLTRVAQNITADLSPDGAGLDRRAPTGASSADSNSEVGQLSGAVNTLLDAVQVQFAARLRKEEQMRQFLADASHELRTPLTSIRGYAELGQMTRRRVEVNSDKGIDRDDFMDRIEAEATRMARLVDDLLVLARGDSQQQITVREQIDVSALVDEAVEFTRRSYPHRIINFMPSYSNKQTPSNAVEGLVVEGSSDQLLRAIRNMVGNAALHTDPAGVITVDVRVTDPADQIVVEVHDKGPGLTPEQVEHVYERFWRSDQSRARTTGGSGLGMAIASNTAVAHGGRIRFDSSVEAGSIVSIYLPLVRGS